MNDIKYAAYRTAVKLRAIEKKTECKFNIKDPYKCSFFVVQLALQKSNKKVT